MSLAIRNRIIYSAALLTALFTFPGCEFIGDIFKAGIWVGIVIVIAVLAVVAFIVKMFKG
ncbi:MAG: hypothetical protein JNK43_05540 [Ignavibacteria bacterium]|nr:hypothetical protein [Ignavibacteria bacterium]